MNPARRTAILECPAEQHSASNLALQNAARFSVTLLGLVYYLTIKKDRMRMSVCFISYFKELTLPKLVGSVRNETDLGNDL